MRQHTGFRGRSPRAGIAGAWVAVALVALAGAASLAIDVSTLVIAAQRCQDVADSAALAGGIWLPDETRAAQAALATLDANNAEGAGWPVTATVDDITFYRPGDTVAGIVLGPWANAMAIRVHSHVDYTFGRLLGIYGANARRRAVVVRGPVEGVPICTMWIAHTTPIEYGVEMNLLMADGPHYAEIPGAFGFLQAPEGCTASWDALLEGYPLTQQDIETSFVNLGDTVYSKTGVDVGHFRKAMVDDHGNSRMERGTTGIYAGDTFYDFHNTNPRILLIPLVTYLGDTGSNAAFRIEKFGAFWLEGVHNKEIRGRFIQYDMPGGDPNPTLDKNTGVFATKLIG